MILVSNILYTCVNNKITKLRVENNCLALSFQKSAVVAALWDIRAQEGDDERRFWFALDLRVGPGDFYLRESAAEVTSVVEEATTRGCGRTVQRQQWALWFARVCLAPYWSILTTSTDPSLKRKRTPPAGGCTVATASVPNNTQCARRTTWSRHCCPASDFSRTSIIISMLRFESRFKSRCLFSRFFFFQK